MSADVISKAVIAAYLKTLIWSESLSLPEGVKTLTWEGSEYEEGTSLQDLLSPDDLPGSIHDSAEEALEGFRTSCIQETGLDPFVWFDANQVATDFALSRNEHGAGFLDDTYEVRAEGPGAGPKMENLAPKLQRCAKYDGTHGLTVWVEGEGDDATLKVEEHS
jgi:hypothetical protein